ncbi:benzoyl-CoA reductase, subunit C [Alkalispirochaeta americana]|uniref:Benzoyl-CoA reductase, subunit C n=1 Tax=Alkalispirochaeta americana TaxID=159291 RepID=A0A1N6SZ27_9SPIO|nr:2-hydroxyacyl-CoA dehydratase family protein [Alkalispirochaeta americana]SIQ46368.1 benzoyl-CoA reductase, subunit C [Alkalispirochaeta americana]
MTNQEILSVFAEAAGNPKKQLHHHLSQGRKVVALAPVYAPEELIHSQGFVPMGAWGADLELQEAKAFFPAFICSITQSIVELGIRGAYEGISAMVIPTLCDSLKVLTQNWKHAVPSIPLIVTSYPQNRGIPAAQEYLKSGLVQISAELEGLGGSPLSEEALAESIDLYNRHRKAMRDLSRILGEHPRISARERSNIFKSAHFMRKEDHLKLVEGLIEGLSGQEAQSLPDQKDDGPASRTRVITTGILADHPRLLTILDEAGFHLVADDLAHESRQYRTDAPAGGDPLNALVERFCNQQHCSVLFDPRKGRASYLADLATRENARGVIYFMTKFCDPEEFDLVPVKRNCDAAGLPFLSIEVDRQMSNFSQARTALETFKELIEQRRM